MSPRRDWFSVPAGGVGFYLVDTKATPTGWNDASRPYLVVERYYAGYQNGMRTQLYGRYSDLDTAKRRLRYCEANK